MNLEVSCHSGYTYAQRPAAFVWRGRRYVVERIQKRWRSPDGPGFQLVTTEGDRFQLIYHDIRDEWFLERLSRGGSGGKQREFSESL